MTKEIDVAAFTHIYSLLRNPLRLRIIILCSERSLIIAELSRRLQLSYANTSRYVARLARAELVEKVRNPDGTINVRSLIRLKAGGAFDFISA